jgi:ABC-type transporter Mla subunit MlaD
MTQVISDIIKGFQDFLAKLEKMSKDVVDEIAAKAPELAQQILVLLRAAFNDIKARISQLLKMAKAKWAALSNKRINTSLGQSASSFSHRLRTKAQDVERRAEDVMAELRSSATAMVEEAKSIIHRLSDSLKSATGDVTEHIRNAGQDVFHHLVTIGQSAVTRTKTFVESSFKDIEVDGSFAFEHSLQITEAATLSAVNPFVIVSIGLSAGIIVLSHNYAQNFETSTD